MQSLSEQEQEQREAELRSKIEPLLMVPFYLVVLAWIAWLFGRW